MLPGRYQPDGSLGKVPLSMALTWSHFDTQTRPSWRDEAACRSTHPDLFFPVGTTGSSIDQTEQAIAVCKTCGSRQACLEFALTTNQDSGIWGATTEEERRKLRRTWLQKKRRLAS